MIKKLNEANAGVKRPLRVSDLQDIWTAINNLNAIEAGSTPIILSGFHDKGDGYLSAGFIAKDGILYYHPDVTGSRIAIGADVYGSALSGVDERVFGDATTQNFSFNMVASAVVSAVSFGAFTLARVKNLRNKIRKVEGVLTFNLSTNAMSFTPDNEYDADVTIQTDGYDKSLNYFQVGLKDGDGNYANNDFIVRGIVTTDMLTLSANGKLPSNIMVDVSNRRNMYFHFQGGLVTYPTEVYSYRVIAMFDV